MSEIEHVKADTNSLAGMKEELNGYITEMGSAIQSMLLACKNLKEHFKGAPADAFQIAISADLLELSRAVDQVQALMQCEEHALDSYETCERVVSGMVGEL